MKFVFCSLMFLVSYSALADPASEKAERCRQKREVIDSVSASCSRGNKRACSDLERLRQEYLEDCTLDV